MSGAPCPPKQPQYDLRPRETFFFLRGRKKKEKTCFSFSFYIHSCSFFLHRFHFEQYASCFLPILFFLFIFFTEEKVHVARTVFKVRVESVENLEQESS